MKPKRTILCVDDNEQSLSHRKIMLETRGYRVVSLSRGEEALERFKQGGIDLVLTDIMMPGLDGFGLLRALRADARTRTLPVILLSARAGEGQGAINSTEQNFAYADQQRTTTGIIVACASTRISP